MDGGHSIFQNMMNTFEQNCYTMTNWIRSRTEEFRKLYMESLNVRCIADNFFKTEFEKEGSGGGSKLQQSNAEISPLLTDIFGAAQDTFTAAVQWFIVYLMKYPDVQREIQDEIDQVVGSQRMPHISERKRFPHLESFIHEVMRHTSFVPTTIPHTTLKDTVLRGYEIPKDTIIFVNQYSVNHDERTWDSPETFNSKRFLDANGNLVSKATDKYMVFSAGMRKCPGELYVTTVGVHLMATLLSVCTFVEKPDKPASLKLEYNLSMRPLPFRVDIHMRKAMLYQVMMEEAELQVPTNSSSSAATSPDVSPQTTRAKTECPLQSVNTPVKTDFRAYGDRNHHSDENQSEVCRFYKSQVLKQHKLFSTAPHEHVIDTAIS